MTNVMNIPMRVTALRLELGDLLEALPITGITPQAAGFAIEREPAAVKYLLAHEYVDIKRPTEGKVPCPDCGDPMDEKRLDERALAITQGKCSECIAYPRRHAIEVERERRVAAFGEGRC